MASQARHKQQKSWQSCVGLGGLHVPRAVGVWIPWQMFGELLLGAGAGEGMLALAPCQPCRWHVLRVAQQGYGNRASKKIIK